MGFTYNDALTSDRDRVRFQLQDTVLNAGPKPGGANFSDAELDGLLSSEGTWQRAVAAGFGVLASAWRIYTDLQVGSRREMYHLIANGFANDAERWNAKYGAAGSAGRAVWTTRVDGYSSDIDAGEV